MGEYKWWLCISPKIRSTRLELLFPCFTILWQHRWHWANKDGKLRERSTEPGGDAECKQRCLTFSHQCSITIAVWRCMPNAKFGVAVHASGRLSWVGAATGVFSTGDEFALRYAFVFSVATPVSTLSKYIFCDFRGCAS